jgi:hypothetical protein
VIDHGIDRGIDGIQPVKGGLRGLPRREFAGADVRRKIGRRESPDIGHCNSCSTAVAASMSRPL